MMLLIRLLEMVFRVLKCNWFLLVRVWRVWLMFFDICLCILWVYCILELRLLIFWYGWLFCIVCRCKFKILWVCFVCFDLNVVEFSIGFVFWVRLREMCDLCELMFIYLYKYFNCFNCFLFFRWKFCRGNGVLF